MQHYFKNIIVPLLLIVFCFPKNNCYAQNERGEIVINAGVGASPGFDGDVSFGNGPTFPATTILTTLPSYNTDNPPGITCYSIIPNIGGTADINVGHHVSMGVAASYQSETLNWRPENQFPSPFTDKITRTNTALRFLYHTAWVSKHYDPYIGIRVGYSFWTDVPSPQNMEWTGVSETTFISKPGEAQFSFQVVGGIHLYINNFFGLHVEAGIGSPYLVEGGLTFRVNPKKPAAAQNNTPGHAPDKMIEK